MGVSYDSISTASQEEEYLSMFDDLGVINSVSTAISSLRSITNVFVTIILIHLFYEYVFADIVLCTALRSPTITRDFPGRARKYTRRRA
jgi:hypothetical protein